MNNLEREDNKLKWESWLKGWGNTQKYSDWSNKIIFS